MSRRDTTTSHPATVTDPVSSPGVPQIDPEFELLIPPLSLDERAQLERNLLAEGCRDPLVVWNGVLADGHNRLAICRQHDLPYRTVELDLPDRDAVRQWILENQLGRRNLTPFSRAEVALKWEPLLRVQARANQGRRTDLSPNLAESQRLPCLDTRETIARTAQLSHGTLSKARFLLEKASEATKQQLRDGKVTIHSAYSALRNDRERKNQVKREMSNAASTTAQRPWKVTSDATVVPCDALITEPPSGLTTESWEPDDPAAFTRGWARSWNDSGAHTIAAFWNPAALWNGRHWLDESLSAYRFDRLLIWHFANPREGEGIRSTYQPVLLYRHLERPAPAATAAAAGELLVDCETALRPQDHLQGEHLLQHPAQQAVGALRWLVALASAPDELVVDPFCGSGTAGIAACQLGRRFLGIDSDHASRSLSERRLATYGAPKALADSRNRAQ